MRFARLLASMAVGTLVLAGCAAQPVTTKGPTSTPWGEIDGRPGRAGVVVAAPHGTSDRGTDEIATEISRRTGFGLVVATGFSIGRDADDGQSRRYHVNRPLEGAPGLRAADERPSEPARRVYQQYEQRVREVSAGPLAFYVEIHGNNRRESANRIEIATVGVDREYAQRLRALCELIRDAHLRGHAGAPRLDVLIEPADQIYYTASAAKRDGILKLPQRALHFELPASARAEWRELYAAILADFITEAIALRPLRTAH